MHTQQLAHQPQHKNHKLRTFWPWKNLTIQAVPAIKLLKKVWNVLIKSLDSRVEVTLQANLIKRSRSSLGHRSEITKEPLTRFSQCDSLGSSSLDFFITAWRFRLQSWKMFRQNDDDIDRSFKISTAKHFLPTLTVNEDIASRTQVSGDTNLNMKLPFSILIKTEVRSSFRWELSRRRSAESAHFVAININ